MEDQIITEKGKVDENIEKNAEMIISSGITAPDAVTITEERKISYSIRDEIFDELEIVHNERAWWMDVRVVRKLIEGFKAGLSVKGARVYAGVSKDKYYHFLSVHPEFSDIIEDLDGGNEVGFMNLINTDGKKDLPTARWYLEKTHPKFMAKEKVEDDRPNVNIQNNVSITQHDANATKMANAIEKLASALIEGPRSETSTPRDRSGMEEEDKGEGV